MENNELINIVCTNIFWSFLQINAKLRRYSLIYAEYIKHISQCFALLAAVMRIISSFSM